MKNTVKNLTMKLGLAMLFSGVLLANAGSVYAQDTFQADCDTVAFFSDSATVSHTEVQKLVYAAAEVNDDC